MVTEEPRASLTTFVPLLSPLAKRHRAAESDGWRVGDEFVDLHVAALRAISRLTKTNPTESNTTLVSLSCHGLNLYVSTLDLATSGKFDVAILLLRAIFDCGPLVYAVGRDDESAKRFNEGRLNGADARKLQVADIASLEPELAAGLNKQWKSEYNAVNKASHVKALHAEKLLTRADGRVTPSVGGREDVEEYRRMFQAANLGEFWHLSSLSNFRVELLGSGWIHRFKAAGKKFASWMRDAK